MFAYTTFIIILIPCLHTWKSASELGFWQFLFYLFDHLFRSRHEDNISLIHCSLSVSDLLGHLLSVLFHRQNQGSSDSCLYAVRRQNVDRIPMSLYLKCIHE